MLDRVKEKLHQLTLSDEQKQKVDDVLAESKAKLQEIRSQATAGGEQAREKLRATVSQTRDKLNSILNDEQKEQMRSWWSAHRPGAAAPSTQPENR